MASAMPVRTLPSGRRAVTVAPASGQSEPREKKPSQPKSMKARTTTRPLQTCDGLLGSQVKPAAGFTCDTSNLSHVCNGLVVVRAFIDFGCDGFFSRGSDWPLAGATVTARLPDGSVRTGVADANGNILLSGVNMVTGETLEIELTDTPAPTWVQQAGFGLQACPSSSSRMTLSASNFGLFRVAFVDFRQSLAGR